MNKEFILPVDEELNTWNLFYVGDIRNFPELIRCEDCENWDTDSYYLSKDEADCYCIMVDHRTAPDFFCGDGKRKEKE